MRLLLLAALAVSLSASTRAQHDHDHDHSAPPPTESSVTADGPVPTGLSASDVNGLLAGAGMGLAKPAELHSYPGPLHVLEHAEALGLTDEQRTATEALRAEVVRRAPEVGARIVGMERHLDELFASGRATDATVDRITGHIARARGELRALHLRIHIAMRDLMTAEQIAAYDRLRGYTE
ncbi:MAG: Spy/CpxP family protein refolding chaperone [Bacteroidota bacterium]